MDRFVQKLVVGPANPERRTQREQEGRPTKRPRFAALNDSDDADESSSRTSADGDDEDLSCLKRRTSNPDEPGDVEVDHDDPPMPRHQTAFENALPAVATDKEAIEEYEAIRASQASQDDTDDASAQTDKRHWAQGKSSIYVDAFNLALDTVLEDEAHLFDNKERCVFEQWRGLSYEAQYLFVLPSPLLSHSTDTCSYVRLFLRKAALWHRIERLGYHSDISDIGVAIACLLEPRPLPDDRPSSRSEDHQHLDLMQDWSLGNRFTFVDSSESCIKNVEEAASLLSLDELKTLAKEAKAQGSNKADLLKAFCRAISRQPGLMAYGLRRSSTNESMGSNILEPREESPGRPETDRSTHFLNKILAVTGPLIRLSEPIFKLFERVHLVFYRSTEWTEKSLTTIILAKIARRNFPQYIVCRSSNIFTSRRHLLEFELSMRKEYELDKILEFNGPPGEEGFRKILDIFDSVSTRWRELIREESHREAHVYEFGEGAYLRRFNPGHAFTRIAHKAAHVLGRLHRYKEEHELLTELLSQHLFHPARRGSWYQRKALLEERYMWEADPGLVSADPDVRKKHWQRIAVSTCEAGLEDRDCHLIYHYDLQKRLLKLEKRLRVPRRLQHDFGHVKLREPEEHTVKGVQLVREDLGANRPAGRAPSTKTIWVDELGDPGEDGQPLQVSVEEMCLSYYRSQGWKGYHSEGGILRTLFAYLFFDVLFVYVPNVFQTAYQTCPLDLHTDAFYPARASQINHRLVEIGNGEAERILREIHEREHDRRTCVVGLNWDFDLEDLAELVNCFDGGALASICKVMAQEYKGRGSGVPDLVLWRTDSSRSQANGHSINGRKGEAMFAEVKSANDRLSDTQRLWINVLTGAGVRVALCNAVAREVRAVT
ncbi:Fanconi-associated nuclease 1 [Madurella mycetomatis]|uniref:Fanconi-associated nuclease n=1 Tax=Madurella mycetomatis TaxID=100816 RepID=A0A175W3I4_9PEZI|nr:Fanconi-associated nuclease 1 [Madurella mycetomatis]